MDQSNPNLAPTPEQGPTPPVPEQPATAEAKPQEPVAAPAPQPAAPPTPATPPAQPTANRPGSTVAPATADDVDVIEKEWVDAAEKVVHDHADDPHAEEEGFEDLQVDYLQKRYGKDIKKPGE